MEPETLVKFIEFLRLNMISPAVRSANGSNEPKLDEGQKRTAYYSGCFTPGDWLKVKAWLKITGIKRVKITE